MSASAASVELLKGLPSNIDAERFILGSILLDDTRFIDIAGLLTNDDFALEKHRRIFQRMTEIHGRGEKIDRVTVANELLRFNELESVDGLSYLVSLDDGLPRISNLDAYVKIIRDKAILRRIAIASEQLKNRALMAEEEPEQILASAEETLLKLGESRTEKGLSTPLQVIQNYEGGLNAFLDPSKRIKGISTGFTKLDEMTGGLHSGELIILAARPSMGKAQPLDARVKTTDGWAKIGHLKPGDELASIDGGSSVVTGVFPQGVKTIYRITFSDGRTAECCGEHLWPVQYRHWDGGRRIISTEKICNLLTRKRYQSRLSIPRISGEFGSGEEDAPISPWLLGFLLGDGCFAGGRLGFTTADAELLQRVNSELSQYNCVGKQADARRGIDYGIVNLETYRAAIPSCGNQASNRLRPEQRAQVVTAYEAGASSTALSAEYKISPSAVLGLVKRRGLEARRATDASKQTRVLVRKLRNLGLYGLVSNQKFIPPVYFELPRESRLELLRGLLDSDGTAEKFGAVTFTSTSKQLAADVQRLVWSLGGIASMRRRITKCEYKGEIRQGQVSYTVGIVVDDPGELFFLERKRRRARRSSKRRPSLRILSVEPIRDAEAVCISVSHPSRLYITDDFIVTHNTAFALNICWHVAARLFQPVAIFSLEMSQESLLTRMLCAAARVDSQRFRAGYLNEQERQKLRAAANQMVEAPIYIDDTAGINLMDMHAKLRRLTQQGQKPGLVVVDYLQLMSVRGRSENRNQEVSQLSRGMKLLSKELDCPFLVLSQLSRATETRVGDHRPQLSDLRESGSIEQDADLVGFIFREEVYKRDREDLRGLAELILAKQRNGPIGKVDLVFLHALTKFENRAEDLGDLPPE